MFAKDRVKRMIAFAVAMAIVCVTLFSFIYGAEHVGHHCTGNDCPICATINQSMNSLKQLGLGVILIAAAAVTIFVETLQRMDYKCFCSVSTLFSQKVRLNN